MAVDYRHGISVLQLVVYLPTIFIAIWLAFRHGFGKSSGWIFFGIFALLRVIGSCCSLATISNPSVGLFVATVVCSSVGLSPLFIGCTGVISRANDSINRKTMNPINPLFFKVVGIITLVALILCILGATADTSSLAALTQIDSKTKIGIILFAVAWVGMCLLLFLISFRYNDLESGEHRLVLAVGLSLPILLVRLIYSILVVFAQNSDFNQISGNVTVYLVMSVLEEMAVVFICLGVGMTLEVRPKPVDIEGERMYPYESTPLPGNGKYDEGAQNMPLQTGRRRQRRQRRGGPITQLVGLAVDAISAQRR